MGTGEDKEDEGEGEDNRGAMMTKTGSNCKDWRQARTGVERVARTRTRTRTRTTKMRVLDECNHTAWREGLGELRDKG